MSEGASRKFVIQKFGGTSFADADRFRHVAALVASEGLDQAVVVSAMVGVTDALLALVASARTRTDAYRGALTALHARHLAMAASILGASRVAFEEALARDVQDLGEILRAVWLGRSASARTEELVAGYGELWSAQLLAGLLADGGRDVAWLDAREVLVVDPSDVGPRVDWTESSARIARWRAAHPRATPIVTGYIASTRDGVPTTFERGGSDFSASIFGALFDATEIVIWTGVDGVLSADPRRVPEAVVVPTMSYDEACELAYFGAKILHPRTVEPAVARGIPIRIRNVLHPERPGSLIASPEAIAGRERRPVAGFSTFDGVELLDLEGARIVGVPGAAERFFGALRDARISVVLISQASSENALCVAVHAAQADRARDVVERVFAKEIAANEIRLTHVPDQTVLAAVGDAMASTPGVAATFFHALGKAGVNVRAIAQGSSERNISAVVDRRDSTRALRAVHAGFVLSNRVLSLGVIGPGVVGRALLEQLAEQASELRERLRLDLQLRAIANSTRMLLSDVPLDPRVAHARLLAEGEPLDLDVFAEHVRAPHLPHAAIVDTTASEVVAERYESFLDRGLHVVTANKRAGAGPLARYRALRAAEPRGRHWLYEATVGAGLPVIATLRDLVRTGDRVDRVEGVLSGTLSYVFNVWDGRVPFSAVVRDAKERGYTEPDPRDDLSGMDVARKLVILAREMGVELELADVQVESLVPEDARDAASPEAFLEALGRSDAAFEAKRLAADERGEVLRYVGVVERSGVARVALVPYSTAHAFAGLSRSDNVFAFTTRRYAAQPLIVRGPGAGPDVTAAGVFGDVLRLVEWLG